MLKPIVTHFLFSAIVQVIGTEVAPGSVLPAEKLLLAPVPPISMFHCWVCPEPTVGAPALRLAITSCTRSDDALITVTLTGEPVPWTAVTPSMGVV